MVNIENFHSGLLKIDKKLYKDIDIYYIGYITVKDCDYVKINIVSPLYLMIHKVNGYIEKNGSKYLIFDSADKNKEILKKYNELWDGIKNKIETINGGKASKHSSAEYGQDFMKIKFDSDDDLPLNKTLKLQNMTVVVRSVFEDKGKFYQQIYLDECRTRTRSQTQGPTPDPKCKLIQPSLCFLIY